MIFLLKSRCEISKIFYNIWCVFYAAHVFHELYMATFWEKPHSALIVHKLYCVFAKIDRVKRHQGLFYG